MKTVSLLRHAKSSWDNPGLKDFDRPLSPRGEKAARRMGAHMGAAGIAPDLILCSAAVRTRATLDLVLTGLKPRPAPLVHCEDALYHASAGAMLTMLRALPDSAAHALVIGHNPGLHALALDLFAEAEPAAKLAIARKFPTAALAVIDFDIPAWRRLAVGDGRLRLYATPKTLPKG